MTAAREWELVVVDNGSSDGTGEYLASLTSRTRGDRVHVISVFEKKRGLAVARNTGWRTAKAEIIAFTDDDCYVSRDYVDSVLHVFHENAEVGFLGGRILLFDSSNCRVTIQESKRLCHFPPRTFIGAGEVQGANMAFRRYVLESIGGFDERMGAGTRFPCEDIDAVASALWVGVPGLYDPRPMVYHHHGRRTEADALEQVRSYDEGRGAYYAKYVLQRRSSLKYVKAWVRSVKREWIDTVRDGRVPLMTRSRRELASGLRFAALGTITRGAKRTV